jgi:hypothetical protein
MKNQAYFTQSAISPYRGCCIHVASGQSWNTSAAGVFQEIDEASHQQKGPADG